jgi:hypothetical protein
MANSELLNKTYQVPENLQKYIGSNISYENIKMIKTRLKKAKKENPEEYKRKGGDETIKWIENSLKTDRDAIYNRKKIGMDTGRENQFIEKHEKDKDNANPTKVGGVPKLNKGNISRKIMSNKEVYNESLKNEIDGIIYLIEYMNNN